MGYLSLTDADRAEMLAAIGVSSIDELFEQIPQGVRFDRELDVPPALPELELVRHFTELAERNAHGGVELSFLGAGIYDHYVPAVVDVLLSRGEFLTAYTPYQPEMSQGVLQAIFEYQTVICELTGMDVSNASGYDGCTVAADACFVAKHTSDRAKVVLAETLNPQVRQVVKTYARGFGLEVTEVPHRGGTIDPDELAAASADAAAVIFQQPNFFGCLEPAPDLAAAARDAGAHAIAHVDLMSLGVLEAPGEYGCAMAIGEGQSVGCPPLYGGPHYGFFAARQDFVRRMPGRIVGETVDLDGRARVRSHAPDARAAHPPREGDLEHHDQPDLARARRARDAGMARPAGAAGGGRDVRRAHRVREGAARPAARVRAADVQRGCGAAAASGARRDPRCAPARRPSRLRARPRLPGNGRRAARRTHGEADSGGRRPAGQPCSRRSADGAHLREEPLRPPRRRACPTTACARPELPSELRRARPPRLPEVSESEIVRHITALADRTFGIDTGFYPLGSCTMKHNPRVNERVGRLAGFRDLHPHQEDDGAQGALELMWDLQGILAEVAGLPAVTLQPAAGSQGELTGLMLMRAYFADRGEERDTIITADTAHGTNPASVTMAGYSLERVETDARGNLDLDDLRGKVNERTAGLMLTNPSTLGLFDEGIEEVARIFHDAGSLLYYDGANLNAVVGISRPGDMGFDIVHYNLHKTFSQPHGGGGPGGGPVAVRETIEPYLPAPVVVREGDAFRLDHDRPKSIGRVRGFAGPFGVFVRSYAYMRAYGPGATGDVRGRGSQRELPPRTAP